MGLPVMSPPAACSGPGDAFGSRASRAPGVLAVLMSGLMLMGCAGGIAETPVNTPPPATDLDTSRAPPQTVTQTPLLPPPPPGAPGETPQVAPAIPTEHLYTEDEQMQIEADLSAAAARAQRR